MPYSLKFDWPRQIAWVRVLLAAVTLGAGYFWPPHAAPFFFFNGLLVLYLVFSLVRGDPRHQRWAACWACWRCSATRFTSWSWLASASAAYGWLPFIFSIC